MKSAGAKVGRKDAVVGQGVAVHFARYFVGETVLGSLSVADAHLFVAFVDVKGAAKGVGDWVLGGEEAGESVKEHVQLEDRAFGSDACSASALSFGATSGVMRERERSV